MCGIAPRHIRTLCDNPWNGGFGYDPITVGNFTLDMIFMLLGDKDYLRSRGNERTIGLSADQAKAVEKDGYLSGRAADGTPIRGKVVGKSVARQLMEQYHKEQQEEFERELQRQRDLENQARISPLRRERMQARAERIARRNEKRLKEQQNGN